MEDFDRLIAECAKRNIKVILDLVFNHSSTSHPWFENMLANPTSKYRNYYIHKDDSINYGTGGMGSFHAAYGEEGKIEYFGAFSPTMPDLNCANPAVKKEFVKIMKFWLERGVAGFRFDAAKHIFDQNELPTGTANMTFNKDFWVELREAARKIKPNVFFIGEVLNKSIPSIGPYAPGFDSLWDFATEDILAGTVGSGSTASLLKTLKRNVDGLTKYDDFVPSYLLSNHDMDRSISVILSKCGVNATDGLAVAAGDPVETVEAKKIALTRAKTAASLCHTLPGLPWVYYGEELGITGIRYANNDISRRDSMIWTKDRKESPKWQNKHQMVRGQNDLTLSVEEQASDPNSLLNHYRNLSALRASSEAIRKGKYKASTWPGYGGADMMAFFRVLEKEDGSNETVFVVHSTSDIQETRAVPANATATLLWSSIPGKTASDQKLTQIVLEPGESAVFNVIE
jgi:glycosidase